MNPSFDFSLFLQRQGASLAPDGIPLRFAEPAVEYAAALEQAVLMDRSHESRLLLEGRDRLNLLQRISTNDLLALREGQGCPTILTNPNGRIIDRLMVYHRGEQTLLLTEPGRGEAVRSYLQRQIFFNDDVRLIDWSGATRLFTIHGPQAEAVVAAFSGAPPPEHRFAAFSADRAGHPVVLVRRKSVSGGHWALIVPAEGAAAVWQALLAAGQPYGLREAGSLTYNALRIRAGRPAVGRELSTDYIPLEAGLWDEVSFNKGCYTGQEIIARMESRGRLAKTLVHLRLASPVDAPAVLVADDRTVGTLSSSVQAPDGEIYGLGFVKMGSAVPGQMLLIGDSRVAAQIVAYAGAQPPALRDEDA